MVRVAAQQSECDEVCDERRVGKAEPAGRARVCVRRRAQIQPGRMIYEIEGVDEATAREAFRLAAAKLSVQTQFVSRAVM